MSISSEQVIKIAELAKLKLSDEEIVQFTHQMNNILSYMDKLNSVDTSGVEPLTHPVLSENTLREDVVVPGISTEDALRNAPDFENNMFKVPKIIG